MIEGENSTPDSHPDAGLGLRSAGAEMASNPADAGLLGLAFSSRTG
jgi:hypothetical protein